MDFIIDLFDPPFELEGEKDKEMLNALIKYFKATDAFYTMAKEIFADTEKGDRRNKKQQSSHFNVSRGGRTLF